jgi:6-phosphofructokinase 1
MATNSKQLGILVGGGPAPGINSVIAAATIRANLEGVDVLGIEGGFAWLMRGDVTHAHQLTIDAVSRIHFRGGSTLGTARENPTKDSKLLETTVASLLRMNVDKLITIGGDDTAYSAMKVEAAAAGRIHVVHVPKTIDNDLDLPHGIPTFGYQTARDVGVEIVRNLMVDAKTTSRWYFVISMGRKAGHLALGIGKAAGATLTVIPEEFVEPKIRLGHVADILVGAIVKRLSYGRTDGVAVLAEGLVERFDEADLEGGLESVERDAHGHVRLAEIDFGDMLKRAVKQRLKELGLSITIADKEIGYELRCADPIPFDMEYTRDLGFSAAQFVLAGGNAAMVSIQEGHFVPLYFKNMIDPETGRTRVRMVDIRSEYYSIARRYMIRLNQSDFDDSHELAKFAAVCGMSVDEFRKRFAYLVAHDRVHREAADKIIKLATGTV